MIIVEYDQGSPPPYMTDGGYWTNPDNYKMIGVGIEGSVPDDATTLTLEELQARERAIHAKYPRAKILPLLYSGEPQIILTDDEVNAVIKEWADVRS